MIWGKIGKRYSLYQYTANSSYSLLGMLMLYITPYIVPFLDMSIMFVKSIRLEFWQDWKLARQEMQGQNQVNQNYLENYQTVNINMSLNWICIFPLVIAWPKLHLWGQVLVISWFNTRSKHQLLELRRWFSWFWKRKISHILVCFILSIHITWFFNGQLSFLIFPTNGRMKEY